MTKKKKKAGEKKEVRKVSVFKKTSARTHDAKVDAVLDELKRLLTKGHRAYRRHEVGEAKRLFSEGKGIAEEQGWERDTAMFNAVMLIIEARFDEASRILEFLLEEPLLNLLGYAYYYLGIARKGMGEDEAAITSFRDSFCDPDYDAVGESWENMGIIFFERGEYDKAIRCFEEALEVTNYDNPGFSWYLKGNAYLEKNEYDEALASYQKALDSANYDTPGVAWDSMGLAYFKKGEYEKAIDYYSKALATPNYETPGYAWFNMGIVYQRKELLEDALEYMIKARDWYKDHESAKVERVEYFIRDIKQQKALRSKGLKEAAEEVGKIASLRVTEPDDPLNLIMDILVENRNKVPKYAAKRGTGYRDVLAVLKGWSSFIPVEFFVEPRGFGNQLSQGGGYFIKAMDKGIVIDPGVDFLVYFTKEGFHIKEVNHVFVSRNHMEHSANLTGIADLYHQWLIYDPKAEKSAPIQFHLNPGTKREYLETLSRMGIRSENVHRIAGRKTPYALKDLGAFDVFGTTYDPKGASKSLGFVLNVRLESGEKRRIGYTSDTDFFKELPARLKDSDIILTHFSIAGPEGFEDSKPNNNRLNYQGLRRLIEGTRAKLYVISKFWGARGDYRIEFVDKLLYDFKKRKRNVKIIPGDVGCLVNLSDLTIRCSNCGAFVPYEEIKITKPEGDFGQLAYLCGKCS
ncbi:tetratricopeptide repeat protein [candidate division WOR-3 bacterium]|nr:tetratricopeptide repeat protein [candidate division WOR-3 bacterium]